MPETCLSGMRITCSATRSASCSYLSLGSPIFSLVWIVASSLQLGQPPPQGQPGLRWMTKPLLWVVEKEFACGVGTAFLYETDLTEDLSEDFDASAFMFLNLYLTVFILYILRERGPGYRNVLIFSFVPNWGELSLI